MSNHPTSIIKRTGETVAFDRHKIQSAIHKAFAAAGAHDAEASARLADEVVARLATSAGTPSVEEIQDLVEAVLVEHNLPRIAKTYILYREERARLRRARAQRRGTADLVPYKTMWHTLAWNVDHDCHTLAGLRRHVERRTFTDLVRAAEQRYAETLEALADVLVDPGGQPPTRLLLLAGPSSSGKTTTTLRLSEALARRGRRAQTLALDHYFHDLHLHPRDASGDHDFETPEALDIQRIDRDVATLVEGGAIERPIYDFKRGRRRTATVPMQLDRDELLILDSLHGLYEPLTRSTPEDLKFRAYIEPVLQLRDDAGRWVRWTDLRLMRRMARDAVHRGYDARATLGHWHYVRRSELKHIIPLQAHADFVINGGLPYEIPVFKPRLGSTFARFVESPEAAALGEDAVRRAQRIAKLFDQVVAASDDAVPPESVLREFIGGSRYSVG